MLNDLTRKEASRVLRSIGIALGYESEAEEYCVNYWYGEEATAYYTGSLLDAYGTGLEMAKARVLLLQQELCTP